MVNEQNGDQFFDENCIKRYCLELAKLTYIMLAYFTEIKVKVKVMNKSKGNEIHTFISDFSEFLFIFIL